MRKVLPVLAIAGLLILAGCAGQMVKTSYSAPPAKVTDGVASENGYELQSSEKFRFNKTVEVNGEQYNVQTTNWITVYKKSESIELGKTNVSSQAMALYAVVSTPSVEIVGQQLNPLASAPTDRVLKRVTEKNENIEIKGKIGESKVTHKATGQTITVEKYDAVFHMPQYNAEVDGYVLVAVFQTDNAVLVTLGAYPDQMKQEEAIHDLIAQTETVDHPPTPGDEDNSTNSSA